MYRLHQQLVGEQTKDRLVFCNRRYHTGFRRGFIGIPGWGRKTKVSRHALFLRTKADRITFRSALPTASWLQRRKRLQKRNGAKSSLSGIFFFFLHFLWLHVPFKPALQGCGFHGFFAVKKEPMVQVKNGGGRILLQALRRYSREMSHSHEHDDHSHSHDHEGGHE